MTLSTNLNKCDNQHQSIWNMLPWFINDSLDEKNYRDVEQHLLYCNVCQKELRAQLKLHKTVNAVKARYISTAKKSFAFNTVTQQISKHNVETTSKARSVDNISVLTKAYHALKNFEIDSIPYSIAASFVIAVSVSIILVQSSNQKIHSPLSDQQATSKLSHTIKTDVNQGQYVTRVIFNKNTSSTSIQSMLTNYHGELSEGPDSRGFYTIDFFSAVNSKQQYQNLLTRLKQVPEILLIKSINQSLRGVQ